MPAYANIGQSDGSVLPQDLRDYFLNFGDPGAGFWNFINGTRTSSGLNQRGSYSLAGNDPLSRFAQSQFDKYQSQWTAQSADDPGLGFANYLQTRSPEQEYAMLTPSQQGMFSSVVTPRARMVLR